MTERTAVRHVPELARDWILTDSDRRWQELDGTLCFADVSGFTALAERLAKRGRVGGEELISRLGGVFSTMLDIAANRGGTLLKFGGDALLLFFQGPDHAVQAASAAVEMRQSLRDASGTPTSVGPLRLSMSMGLHSGPAHFFLVGASHRELVLLGDAARSVTSVEGSARAGEIALSPTTVAQLPNGAAKEQAEGPALLRWRNQRSVRLISGRTRQRLRTPFNPFCQHCFMIIWQLLPNPSTELPASRSSAFLVPMRFSLPAHPSVSLTRWTQRSVQFNPAWMLKGS